MKRLLAAFLLVALSYAPLAAQEEPAADSPLPENAAVNKPAFTAHMLLIKSDWSQAPSPKTIVKELREALKDASVPQELLDALPASAPQILFGPEIVSLYTHEQYAQLKAWLKEKELLISEEPFQRLKQVPDSDKRTVLQLAKDETFIELPALPPARRQAFVTRKQELSWSLYTPPGSYTAPRVAFGRYLTIREDVRGRSAPINTTILDASDFEFELPGERVALINGFPAGTELSYLVAARKKGFEVVVAVVSGESDRLEAGAKPRVSAPDSVQTVTVTHTGTVGSTYATKSQPREWAHVYPSRAQAYPSGGQTYPSGGQANRSSQDSKAAEFLEVVALKNARAGQVEDLLQQLFAGKSLVAIADERANSLVLRGAQEQLEIAKKLLMQLDRPAADDAANKPSSRWSRPLPDEAPQLTLSREYEAAQEQAAKLAAELRDKLQHYGTAHPQVQKLRDELRSAVATTFNARQQMLEMELAEFQERMTRVKEMLDLRSNARNQIIERRMEELLDPQARPAKNPLSLKTPRRAASSAADDAAAGPSQGEEEPAAPRRRSSNPLAAETPSSRSLSTITDLRSRIAALTDEVRRLDNALNGKSRPTNDGTLQQKREILAQRLQEAREELDTLIRLQELEIQEAASGLSVAQAELKLAEEANRKQPGNFSQTEIQKLRHLAEAAAVRVEKAKTTLEFLFKARPEEGTGKGETGNGTKE